MNLKELKDQLAKVKGEVRTLLDENKVDEAEAKMEEKRSLAKQIKIAEELEAEAIEERNTQVQLEQIAMEDINKIKEEKKEVRKVANKVDKEQRARAFLKNVANMELTEEERSAVASLTGEGSVIPEEFVNQKQNLTYGDDDLEARCQVIPVTSVQGSIPVQELNGFLAELDENGKIVGAAPSLSAIDYKVTGYFALTGLSNDTIESTPLSAINDIIIPDYNVRSKNSRNKAIVAAVNSNSTTVTVAADAKVEDVLAKTISKTAPSYRNGLVVITNAEGYSYIDNLKDTTGRRDDRVTEKDGKLFFKSKEIIALDSTVLPALGASKTMVFYVVNLKTIPFCKMKAVNIKESNGEYGFDTDKTFFKVSTKFGIAKIAKDIVKAQKIEG